jgi:hypothetical protein
MLSLSLAGPGQETMYCWSGIGITVGIRSGRDGKPNVLCTMCLFSSGIGLKEAVSPWNERRGDQGKGVIEAGQCCPSAMAALGAIEREEEGRNVPMWQGSKGGFSRVAGVVQYHFVLNLTPAVLLFHVLLHSILKLSVVPVIVSAKLLLRHPLYVHAQHNEATIGRNVAVKG